jgi:hypothetical protein
LTSSTGFAVVGQPVTFTARVSPTSPGNIPTGTVSFNLDGTTIGTATVNKATDQATFTTSTFGSGEYSITAVYSGNTTLQSSESSAVTVFVSPASTAPVLTFRPVLNRSGQLTAVNVVAQVLVTAPGTGVPSGTVTFFLNGIEGPTIFLNSGVAILRLRRLRALDRSVSATYNGDGQFNVSSSVTRVISPPFVKNRTRVVANLAMPGQGDSETPGHHHRRLLLGTIHLGRRRHRSD